MTENSTPNAPSPASNQNLIIGLILGAGVLMLLLLVLNMRDRGIGGAGGSSSELEALRTELAERRDFVNAERRRLGLPPLGADASGQTVESLASRISNDSTDLVAMVRQMQKLLAEKESRLANIDTNIDALSNQNTLLKDQLAQLQGSAEDAESMRNRLATAQSLYETAQGTIERLQSELAGAASGPETAALREQVEAALAERDKAETELAKISGEITTLRAENVELTYELQEVRAELGRTRLFVESADLLPAAAKALFVQLAEFETIGGEALAKEYAAIDGKLRARVLNNISFQTGSSRITQDKVEETRLALQNAEDESFFLVVGYASKTGNFESNRQLSADRATTIASVIDSTKKPGQAVQAVFLSQTDRFSATDDLKNQICEIWEIRK